MKIYRANKNMTLSVFNNGKVYEVIDFSESNNTCAVDKLISQKYIENLKMFKNKEIVILRDTAKEAKKKTKEVTPKEDKIKEVKTKSYQTAAEYLLVNFKIVANDPETINASAKECGIKFII